MLNKIKTNQQRKSIRYRIITTGFPHNTLDILVYAQVQCRGPNSSNCPETVIFEGGLEYFVGHVNVLTIGTGTYNDTAVFRAEVKYFKRM